MYNFNNTAILVLGMCAMIIAGIIAFIALIVMGASKKKKGASSVLIGAAVCLALNMATMVLLGENGSNYDDFVPIFLFIIIVGPIASGIIAYHKIYKDTPPI